MAKKQVKREGSPETKIQLSASTVLKTMNDILSVPVEDRLKDWFPVMVALDNNLVGYLRGNGPTPDWEAYPLARSWFSQNGLVLKAD